MLKKSAALQTISRDCTLLTFIVIEETKTKIKRKEKLAFSHLKKLMTTSWENIARSEDNLRVLNDLQSHYHDMGCNMALKFHVLNSHLDILRRILVM